MTKTNANNTNSLKREKNTQSAQKTAESSCNCLGKKTKKKSKAFFTGVATNLGICILLFGYTLIGSVIFLSIEGNNYCLLFCILLTKLFSKNILTLKSITFVQFYYWILFHRRTKLPTSNFGNHISSGSWQPEPNQRAQNEKRQSQNENRRKFVANHWRPKYFVQRKLDHPGSSRNHQVTTLTMVTLSIIFKSLFG